MAERYEDNFSLYSTVLYETKVLKRLFRAASGSIAYLNIDEDTIRYDTHAAEQYFALYWQQFDAAVLHEEPDNELFRKSLVHSDAEVRRLFDCDGMPHELLD